MEVTAIIARCRELQAELIPEGKYLRVRSPGPLPEELREELRQHKDEIIALLESQDNTKTSRLSERYRPKYTDANSRDLELKEIGSRVCKEGYVLLWSKVLDDFIAFYHSEKDRENIPPGFVPYSEAELSQLFMGGKPKLSEQTLRLIHEAKKLGATVTDYECKNDLPAEEESV